MLDVATIPFSARLEEILRLCYNPTVITVAIRQGSPSHSDRKIGRVESDGRGRLWNKILTRRLESYTMGLAADAQDPGEFSTLLKLEDHSPESSMSIKMLIRRI